MDMVPLSTEQSAALARHTCTWPTINKIYSDTPEPCVECEHDRAAFEAKIVAAPSGRDAAVAEALSLIVAGATRTDVSWPYGYRRLRFLTDWLVAQSSGTRDAVL